MKSISELRLATEAAFHEVEKKASEMNRQARTASRREESEYSLLRSKWQSLRAELNFMEEKEDKARIKAEKKKSPKPVKPLVVKATKPVKPLVVKPKPLKVVKIKPEVAKKIVLTKSSKTKYSLVPQSKAIKKSKP